MSTRAPKYTARAIATHWRSPPDNVPIGCSTSRRSIPMAASSVLVIVFIVLAAIGRVLRLFRAPGAMPVTT